MAKTSLAVKYRPNNWDSVVEQDSTKVILQHQLECNEVQHCYLFVGGAGTGKTTTARIFANEINKGQGNPIELDAASNNSVDDMRELIQQAQTKSLNSEYKVFIIDECHMITVQGWNAILKLIEEPPVKSIFIFCTTDPQKIPKTILSRVQRYDFRRISQKGIVDRLTEIVVRENSQDYDDPNFRDIGDIVHYPDAIEYIAKIADGGMRDAITLLDKCLAYSSELTLENVVKALGTVDYNLMFKLTDNIMCLHNDKKMNQVVDIIESIYDAGKDLKQFMKQYTYFLLDVLKYSIGCDWKYLNLPKLEEYEQWFNEMDDASYDICIDLLDCCKDLNVAIKYSTSPKLEIEAALLLFMRRSRV